MCKMVHESTHRQPKRLLETKVMCHVGPCLSKSPGSLRIRLYVLRKGISPNQSYDLGMRIFDHQSYEKSAGSMILRVFHCSDDLYNLIHCSLRGLELALKAESQDLSGGQVKSKYHLGCDIPPTWRSIPGLVSG